MNWILFMFMFEPCCDMTITRFETEKQCEAALDAYVDFAQRVPQINPKGYSVACSDLEKPR